MMGMMGIGIGIWIGRGLGVWLRVRGAGVGVGPEAGGFRGGWVPRRVGPGGKIAGSREKLERAWNRPLNLWERRSTGPGVCLFRVS